MTIKDEVVPRNVTDRDAEQITTTSIITEYKQQVDQPEPVPIQTRNRGLPDTDDTSMNHVFQYIENYERDLFWSFLSDSLFVTGGILYIILSIWDCLGQSNGADDDAEAAINYYTLDFWAPAIYFMNSLVDIQWAVQSRQSYKTKLKMSLQWDAWRDYWELLSDNQEENSNTDIPNHSTSNKYNALSCCQRLRKHAAHRRTLFAAATFGIAALLELMAVPLSYYDEANHIATNWNSILNISSDHVYIVSAIIAIVGKRNRPWLTRNIVVSTTTTSDNTSTASPSQQPSKQQQPRLYEPFWNQPEVLEDLGDLMFLVGSVMDGMLNYVSWDGNRTSLVSSCLWMLDACLYLRSDCILANRVRGGGNNNNNDGQHFGLV